MTFSPSPGQAHERTGAASCSTACAPQQKNLSIVMDRAYEGCQRDAANSHWSWDLLTVVPPPLPESPMGIVDKELYKRRNEVDQFSDGRTASFRRLKGFRRIFSRIRQASVY